LNYDPRTKRGLLIAGSVLAGLLFPVIAIILLLIAGALISWSQNQAKTEEFFRGIPFGQEIMTALARFDAMIS